MRQQRLYGRLARENIEEGAVAQPDPNAAPAPATVEEGAAPADVLPEGSDGLEAELVSINDELVDLQADEAGTDEAVEVIDEMNVAVESLRIIAGNGGLDKGGAQLLNLMQASWNRRLDLEPNHNTLSTESFGGSNTRAGQTTLAAESIAEKAKGVWNTIVELFKKALAAISNIWKRIFDGATRIKARAEQLAKVAAGVKGEANAKTFEDQGLAEKLHINGTVDIKAAAAALVSEGDVLAGLSKHATDFANDTVNALTAGPQPEGSDMAGGGDANLQALLKKARNLAQGDFQKVADPASVGVTAPEGCELFRGKALPGNKAVIAIIPAAEGVQTEADGKAFRAAGYRIGMFDASKKVGEKAQLPTLSPADVEAIAKQMISVSEKLSHYQTLQKQAEEASKKVIAAVEQMAKAQAEAEITGSSENPSKGDKIAGKVFGWAMGMVGQAVAKCAMGMVTNAAPPVAGYILNAAGSVLQYGEKSLKQYGAAKPAEKKAPEGAAAPAPAAAAA